MTPGPAPSQTAVLLSAVVVAALGVVALFGVFLIRRDPPWTDRRTGASELMPPVVVGFVHWLVEPLADGLGGLRVRPNHVTAASLGFAALTALALAGGRTALGCLLLVATGTCDLLDGLLARRFDAGSAAGAFFDSFADRISESIVFAGLAVWGAGGALTWLSIWALVASLAISYARARGEGLGVEGAVGLMQRPERMALLTVTLFVASLAPLWSGEDVSAAILRVASLGVGLLAVLSSVTALRRAHFVFEALDR